MHRSHSLGFRSNVYASSLVATIVIIGCASPTDTRDTSEELFLEPRTETSLPGTAGEDVTPVPVVRVTNSAGRPMPAIAVSFEVVGGGTVRNASAWTDANGSATVGSWTLGTVARAYTVTARVSDAAHVVFTVIAQPGPAALMTRVSGEGQTAVVGDTLSNRLRVRVADQFGNAIERAPVHFTVLSGDGTVVGNSSMTSEDGIATSGAWSLGPVLGAQQIRAQFERVHAVFTAYACAESCRHVQLLFVRDGQIFSTNLVGESPRQLTTDSGGRAANPAWSPDGRRIAFVRDRTMGGQLLSGAELYVADADGSNAVRRAVGFHSPAWSPDGRRMAVTAGDCIYSCETFVLTVDEESAPPAYVASQAADPAWSPDGTRIAFVSLSGDDGYHELRVMNADGSEVTSITRRDPGGIFRPTWSPDGRRIAFSKCGDGGCNIFAVNSDGTALVQLTTVGNAFGPAWSPDGTRIAFTLWSSGANESSVAYVAADRVGDPIPIVSPGQTPAWRP